MESDTSPTSKVELRDLEAATEAIDNELDQIDSELADARKQIKSFHNGTPMYRRQMPPFRRANRRRTAMPKYYGLAQATNEPKPDDPHLYRPKPDAKLTLPTTNISAIDTTNDSNDNNSDNNDDSNAIMEPTKSELSSLITVSQTDKDTRKETVTKAPESVPKSGGEKVTLKSRTRNMFSVLQRHLLADSGVRSNDRRHSAIGLTSTKQSSPSLSTTTAARRRHSNGADTRIAMDDNLTNNSASQLSDDKLRSKKMESAARRLLTEQYRETDRLLHQKRMEAIEAKKREKIELKQYIDWLYDHKSNLDTSQKIRTYYRPIQQYCVAFPRHNTTDDTNFVSWLPNHTLINDRPQTYTRLLDDSNAKIEKLIDCKISKLMSKEKKTPQLNEKFRRLIFGDMDTDSIDYTPETTDLAISKILSYFARGSKRDPTSIGKDKPHHRSRSHSRSHSHSRRRRYIKTDDDDDRRRHKTRDNYGDRDRNRDRDRARERQRYRDRHTKTGNHSRSRSRSHNRNRSHSRSRSRDGRGKRRIELQTENETVSTTNRRSLPFTDFVDPDDTAMQKSIPMTHTRLESTLHSFV